MFSWIPIHRETIEKLLKLGASGTEPLATLQAMADAGLKIVSLRDRDARGRSIPLAEMDPFTFFAVFNRGIKTANRRENWVFLKQRWGLESPVPDDFTGIPTLHNVASRLFPDSSQRPKDHIRLLWDLAAQAVRGGIDSIDADLFDRCLALPIIGTSNLTIGLFWIQPQKFLPADHKTTAMGEQRGIDRPVESHAGYARWLAEMTREFGSDYAKVSHDAHLLATSGDKKTGAAIAESQMKRLWERFHERIGGFVDFENPGEEFVEYETGYKHALLAKFAKELGRERLAEMIARGAGTEAVKSLQRVLASNITSFHSWNPTLGASDEISACALEPYLRATEEPYSGAQSIRPIFETAAGLGLKPCWDVVSLLLWVLRPADYFPIKISHYRALAEELDRPLPKGKIAAQKVEEVLTLGRDLRAALAPQKPRDWVDVQSFLWCVCPSSYGSNKEEKEWPSDAMPDSDDARPRWWWLAAGVSGEHWEEFRRDGIAAIGARGATDLRSFATKESLRAEIQRISGNDHNNKNEVLACWQFLHEMRPGDVVIAKIGTRTILGRGEVLGDYEYEASRPNYRHIRKVRWTTHGKWKLPADRRLVRKTLTDITRFTEHIRVIAELTGSEASPLPQPRVDSGQSGASANYWWLNANPKIWDFDRMHLGQCQTYTSHNNGHKRQKYRWFQEVRPGDLVVGYVTNPQKEVVAICRITKGLHQGTSGEEIEFEKIEHLSRPLPYSLLQAQPDLNTCEPILGNRGSLFRLTEAEYEVIRALIDESAPPLREDPRPYTKADALKDVFLPPERFDAMLKAVEERKNVILQGAPGVGKTFLATRLAYALMGVKDEERLTRIQFHQSYSYEDFVQGFRPTPKGTFELRHGVFFNFCRNAQRDVEKKRPWVFIIDEINRGNLSKIFGELLMLIESDKRGPRDAMPLACSQDPEDVFYVPENVYIIGMMNTADRSLAMVDYALRRRFRFLKLEPEFGSPGFRRHLENAGATEALVSRIVDRMTALNDVIGNDAKNLGPGYQLGHSYFCVNGGSKPDDDWYCRIVESEIVPMLEEYWPDSESKVAKAKDQLLA